MESTWHVMCYPLSCQKVYLSAVSVATRGTAPSRWLSCCPYRQFSSSRHSACHAPRRRHHRRERVRRASRMKTRLDKLEKDFERHICLKRDCCSGCNDYATRIEKLWRTKPTNISRETRRRLNKKHAEIGGRFELLAGRWQQREGR